MINVTCITEKLGHDLVGALPGYHAFTGSDFTAAFARQGKVKPFEIMEKNKEFIGIINKLGETLTLSEEEIAGLEKFVCAMYSHPRYSSVSEVRYSLLIKKTAPKVEYKAFSRVKGIDPTMLPPSKPALIQKIKRSNSVSWMWKRADCRKPDDGLDPTEHGWYSENGRYHIKWYNGPTLPENFETTTEEDSEKEDEESDFDSDSTTSYESEEDIQ
jgi:hypothetical protein